MVGIYKITNKVNGKSYIGQSVDIMDRWKSHRNKPFNQNSKDYDSLFYRAIRKYGLENFNFEIIEECKKEELNEKERYWIKFYHTYAGDIDNNGYNLTLGGETNAVTQQQIDNAEEIKQLLLTTQMTQVEIGKKFGLSHVSISYINNGRTWHDDDLTYPLREPVGVTPKEIREKKCFCIDCGKQITNKAKRCYECNLLYLKEKNRKQPSVTRNELEKLLLQNNGNFVEVGKIFNLTDNAIRKWCDKFGLSRHSNDYKEKKEKPKKSFEIKKVIMLDINTEEELKEFANSEQAGAYLGKTSGAHIREAATGKRKTAYGYKWKFKNVVE